MDAELFQADIEATPQHLAHLADLLEAHGPWESTGANAGSRILLLGMGSSHYANAVGAARLRARGLDAIAELASSDLLPPPRPDMLVIGVSASGASTETLAALDQYVGVSPIVAVTNTPGSAIVDRASHVVDLAAGDEVGGVACRSFQHTLAQLMALEDHLLGARWSIDRIRAAAHAVDDLLSASGSWLNPVTELLAGPEGTHLVAPARRLSSAQQGALMLREGPRRQAVGCETGDWSHVDVYLTKTTDYRMLLFAGSRWEPEVLRWAGERGTTVVSVGGAVAGAAAQVRFAGDDDDDVRLLSEVVVPELVAAALWRSA